MTRILCIVIMVVLPALLPSAEDLPLGSVVQVEGGAFTVEFHADHALEPDSVVHFYGPGEVEKHPLTGKVGVEHRAFVGKGHVLRVDGRQVSGRIFALVDDAQIAVGYDAVPVRGEGSPDAPPVLDDELGVLSVPAEQTIAIELPVRDPEGEALSVVWSTRGTTGATGHLQARTTTQARNRWTAPGVPGRLEILARASDPAGGSLEVVQPVEVAPVDPGQSERALTVLARSGERRAPLRRLRRGPRGRWWGIDVRGVIQVVQPGWIGRQAFAVQEDADVDDVIALHPGPDDLVALLGRELAVLGYDGVLRARIGGLAEGSDVVRDAAGAIYVADQDAGGVMVFEPDGRFRCRLGRPGDAPGSFRRLRRIAIDAAGTLYALDAAAWRIQRYDRHHRRLPDWEIQGDREIVPVDLAAHASGLLLLSSDGSIRIFDEDGLANRALQPLAAAGFGDRLRRPSAITSDANHDIFVTYPEPDLIARYHAEGRLTGVRGGELDRGEGHALDGRGYRYVLDRRDARLSRLDPQGWMVARSGGEDDGPFEEPGAMAVAHDGSHVFVIDVDRTVILRFETAEPAAAPFVFGQRGRNPGQFEEPAAIAVDGERRVYVLDVDQRQVVVFDVSGHFLFNVGGPGDVLEEPTMLAVDPDGESLYVYDEDRYEVVKFALDHDAGSARHVSNAGGRGREIGQFSEPVGLACDRLGLLYVADEDRRDLQVMDFSGSNAVTLHSFDLEAVDFSRPRAMALSPDGRVLLVDGERRLELGWK